MRVPGETDTDQLGVYLRPPRSRVIEILEQDQPRAFGHHETVAVDVERGRIRVTPGWPPTVHVTSNTRTHVNIGDGTYRTRLVRSSFRDFDQTTPDGLATVQNAGRAVTEIVALVSGTVAIRDAADLDLNGRGATELGGAVSAQDPYRMMRELSVVMAEESDRVAEWLWRTANVDCADFLSAVCPVLSEVVFATEIIAAGESRIPFFSRLVTAEPSVEPSSTATTSKLDSVCRRRLAIHSSRYEPGSRTGRRTETSGDSITIKRITDHRRSRQ